MRLLPRRYSPDHTANRMESEGDLLQAHAEFPVKAKNNLHFLLHNRYEWMNRFIRPDDIVIEIGAGAGFSKGFIKGNVIMTEIAPYPWVTICLDAMNLPFGSDTIDVVICVNALHHFVTPIKVLHDLNRCLKPGGYVLLFEPNPSFLFLLLLRIMRHEGWSFDVDVFDPTACVNDPADPWSGNNAISYLMFRDRSVFQKNAPEYQILHDNFAECMTFPLSGGVTAKTKTIELPMAILRIIDWIDRKLCRLWPMMFAMGRSVVLRKQRRVMA
jgi:SAM-dependent methyltransferase